MRDAVQPGNAAGIHPGQRFRENDRSPHSEVYTVASIRNGIALLEHHGTVCVSGVRVPVERLFTDGQARRYGWSEVRDRTEDACNGR